jgi:hypothetical protein
VNLVALYLIAFCAVAGALAGSWLWGLLVGLGIVLIANLAAID